MYKRRLLPNNQKGSIMIETMLASLIGIMFVFGSITAMNDVFKTSQNFALKSNQQKSTMNFLEAIKANGALFQRHSMALSSSDKEKFLSLSKLPIAFSQNGITSVDKCAECPGRAGYIIEPMGKGLYQVTVRIYNNKDDPSSLRDVKIIVGDNQ